MSNVDDQIVNMKFNNSEFERNAGQSLGTLGKLQSALQFKNAGSGLENVQKSVKGFSFGPITSGIEGVSKGFLAMSAVAYTALARVTNAGITAGIAVGKSLTFAPILDGLKEYELNLNSIQTILANTESKGETLKSVQAALDTLNTYSDKTIYNFAQMASNVKTFTAAGVDLDKSVSSIKGLSNVAALFGVDATDAARGMFQLSRGIASGVIRLQDWMSLENSGLAGVAFQDSLKETARVHGIAIDDMIKESGSFRNSLSKNWLTSALMVETLSKFTGELSDEQLKNMGYTQDQIKDIQRLAATAEESATKVKTLSQLMGTLKEAAGSGWAKTWGILFGNLGSARKLFTDINTVVGGFIQTNADARNKVLSDWRALDGRKVLIEGLSDGFHAMLRVLRPISKAFRDLFPAKTGQDLFNMTKAFADFMESLKIGDDTMDRLRRTFRGVFAVFDIVMQVVSGAFGLFKNLFGAISDGSGGFLELTGDIGDFLFNLSQTLEKTGAIENFFEKLGNILKVPLLLLRLVAGVFGKLFSGLDTADLTNLSDSFGKISDKLNPMEKIAKFAAKAWDVLIDILKKAGDFIQPFVDTITGAFEGLGKGLAESLKSGNFNAVLQVINTALLGGILLLVRNFFKKGFGIDLGTGGFFGSLTNLFGELGDTLQAFQNQTNAKALLLIAGAIAVLALSVLLLSKIDDQELGRALAALGGLSGALVALMASLNIITSGKGFLKLPVVAAALILLGVSILILTAALKILATMDWKEIAKGMAGLSGILLALSLAVKPMSANSAGMITAGLGIIAISAAIVILSLALKTFAKMKWEEIAKGLVTLGITLAILAGAMKLMDFSTMKVQSLALIAMSVAVLILAKAVEKFGKMDTKTIAKGLISMAIALGLMVAAMNLMPKDLGSSAVGLLIAAGAMIILAKALQMMGNLENVGQALVVMGVSLLMLALGLKAMEGSLTGAAALAIAAGSLVVIAHALKLIGKMSVGTIAKALLAVAAAFVILGVAGYLLAPVAPVILALAGSLLAIGAGLVLAGTGALLFATAFAIFVAALTAGVAVLTVIIQLLPLLFQNLALGIVSFITTLAKNADVMFAGLGKLLFGFVTMLIDGLIKLFPKLGELLNKMVDFIIQVMNENIPDLQEAGYKLLIAILTGLRDHIKEIVDVAVDLVLRFMDALGNRQKDLADGAVELLLDFLRAFRGAIREHAEEIGTEGGKVAVEIVRGIVVGIGAGVEEVLSAVRQLVSDAKTEFVNSFNPLEWASGLGEQVGGAIVDGVKPRKIAPGDVLDTSDLKGGDLDLSVDNIDLQPTITPVLDLSEVERMLPVLASLLSGTTDLSALVATIGTSGSPLDPNKVEETKDEGTGDVNVTMEQNLYSPKAIDRVDVFRATRNQMSQLEEVIRR